MHDDIAEYCRQLADTLAAIPYAALAEAGEELLDCRRRGATIFILGNGGSAATASHFACDLAKGTRFQGRPSFRVVPLTDNVPLLTAWGNDTSYDRVFAEQLAPLVRPGDIVVAISASGNSPNVVAAAESARVGGARVISLTGKTGGLLADRSDLTIRVPTASIEQIEDAHLAICHGLCVALRASVAEEEGAPSFQAAAGGEVPAALRQRPHLVK